MKTIAVVGSGIAGLYSALFLSKRGYKVTLLDSAPRLGGLLKTVPNEDGVSFDCGAHFLRDTGIAEIDEELFHALGDGWQRLGGLRVGTHYNGHHYSCSPYINAHHLNAADYDKSMLEMMHLPPHYDYTSCQDYLLKRYGPTLTAKLFSEPLLKFYKDEPLENLGPLAPRFFDLVRILCFTPEVSRELKKSKWFDDRIGFHLNTEGASSLKNYYPKKGGIGQFIDFFETLLLKNKVDIRLSEKITSVEFENDSAASLKTESGNDMTLDHLVWTLPVGFLNKLAGRSSPPVNYKINHTLLVDLISDKPFTTDSYYVVAFNKKYRSFRITLYPNCNAGPVRDGVYHTCVEVICTKDELKTVQPEAIFAELVDMKLLPKDAKMTYSRLRTESAGFPIYTHEFIKQTASEREFAKKYKNILFVGKAKGDIFFMNETLVDTYKSMKQFSGEALA